MVSAAAGGATPLAGGATGTIALDDNIYIGTDTTALITVSDNDSLVNKDPTTVDTIYSLACLQAVRGKRAEALAYLNLAVENGWSDVEHIVQDQDLTSLHGDPEFDAIIARARVARIRK